MARKLAASIRYQVIDNCLRNTRRQYTLADLQKECAQALNEAIGKTEEPSIRTLRKDIATMRNGVLGYSAPIVNVKSDSKKPDYYSYSDPNFSIKNFSLNEDVKALQDSRAMSPYLAPKENPSKKNIPSSSSGPKKNNFQKFGWKIDPQVNKEIFKKLQHGINDFYKKQDKKK